MTLFRRIFTSMYQPEARSYAQTAPTFQAERAFQTEPATNNKIRSF
jgi:hypothetical protein